MNATTIIPLRYVMLLSLDSFAVCHMKLSPCSSLLVICLVARWRVLFGVLCCAVPRLTKNGDDHHKPLRPSVLPETYRAHGLLSCCLCRQQSDARLDAPAIVLIAIIFMVASRATAMQIVHHSRHSLRPGKANNKHHNYLSCKLYLLIKIVSI
jgi:hypothetical protein